MKLDRSNNEYNWKPDVPYWLGDSWFIYSMKDVKQIAFRMVPVKVTFGPLPTTPQDYSPADYMFFDRCGGYQPNRDGYFHYKHFGDWRRAGEE